MIFKRLFTPDYAKPDPQTRQAAINKLSPEEAQARKILHELAFNDESVDVSIAALERLNSFALWQKMAQIAKAERLKRTAKKVVSDAVLNLNGISEQECQQFLLESADVELLNQVLLSNHMVYQDPQLILTLLKKLNRATVREQVFIKHACDNLRRLMIEEENDLKMLQKWLKKSPSQIKSNIEQRFEELSALEQRPKQISQAATLILSKLQALVDKADYVDFSERRRLLDEEFQILQAEFGCLATRDSDEFYAKYKAISERLDYVEKRLYEAYQDVKQFEEQNFLQKTLEKTIAELSFQIENSLTQIETLALADLEILQLNLQTLQQQAEDARPKLDMSVYEPIAQAIQTLNIHINQLPKWLQHHQGMKDFFAEWETKIASFQEQPKATTDALSIFEQLYLQLNDEGSPLSGQYKDTFIALRNHLRQISKTFWKQIDSRTNKMRKDILGAQRLVQNGRYRAALKRFEALHKDWNDADEDIKIRLEKSYVALASEIEKLNGWQDYIGTSRKPELLAEAEKLVNDSEMDIKTRADAVKLLRKQWQSLSLSAVGDEEQNQAFNELLEVAFAPCREHYSEQTKKREAATHQRLSVLQKMNDLHSADLSNKEKLSHFNNIQKQWLAADPLPKRQYQVLKEEYETLKEKVFSSFESWFAENGRAKLRLIEKVSALVDSEDKSDAVAQAKQLQQKWKTIETAGFGKDKKLWNDFRRINDLIFANFHASLKEEQDQITQKASQLSEEVANLSDSVSKVTPQAFELHYQQLNQAIVRLPKKVNGQLLADLNKVRDKFSAHQQEVVNANKTKQIDSLIEVLEFSLNNNRMPDDNQEVWSTIDKIYKKALLRNSETKGEMPREDALLCMEILADMPINENHQDKANHLKMQLLEKSMNSGKKIQALDYLLIWLNHGVVAQEEASHIPRIKACLHTSLQ